MQTEQNTEDVQLSHEAMVMMLEVARGQDEALRRERERRRELEHQLEEMRRMVEEMGRQLDEVPVCHCEECEEGRLDSIDVDGLLDGFIVDDGDEHFDPMSTFRERGQVLDQEELHQEE